MLLVRSPLAYQGSKFRLFNALRQQLGDFKVLHDVFGGSGTVAINAVPYGQVLYNDWDHNAYAVLSKLKAAPSSDRIISRLDNTIKKHKLDRSSDSAYFRFRDYYNSNPDPFTLWVLSKHSFSSLMRFSGKTGFNLPFGKRSPAKSASRDFWIESFWARLQSIELHNLSYLSYVKKYYKSACVDTVFYFDPPYLASGANVYKGTWSEDDDIKLFSLLDYLDSRNIKWLMSNVVHHRHFTNTRLIKWMKNYNVHYPDFKNKGEGYILNRAATSGPNNTVEVMIKNF